MDQLKELFAEIDRAFRELVFFLDENKETFNKNSANGEYARLGKIDIKRLKVFFDSFQDWKNQLLISGVWNEQPFIGCSFFSSKKVDTTDGALRQTKRWLKRAISDHEKSYYKTLGADKPVQFHLEPRNTEGEYLLKVLYDEKPVSSILYEALSRTTEDSSHELHDAPGNNYLACYLQRICRQYSLLDLKHMGILLPGEEGIDLASVFIKLKATPNVSRIDALPLTDSAAMLAGVKGEASIQEVTEPDDSYLEIEQLLFKKEEGDSIPQRIVLLGHAGSGKSTILRYLANSFATEKFNDIGLGCYVPILVDLGRFSQSSSEDLVGYALDSAVLGIADPAVKKGIRDFLNDCIISCDGHSTPTNRVIFLFDSFDEIGENKANITELIEKISKDYPLSAVVVSSRITNYYETPLIGFTPYELEILGPEMIRVFLGDWFGVISQSKLIDLQDNDRQGWVDNRVSFLVDTINNSPSLQRIATNPLYLTFLVMLASDPSCRLPKSIAAILESYMQRLLSAWQRKSNRSLIVSYDTLLDGFYEICWIVHQAIFSRNKKLPTTKYVKGKLKQIFPDHAGQIIEFWINLGILFKAEDANMKEVLLPRHLTFLEYGFASCLADLWANPDKREEVWSSYCANARETTIQNTALYSPLKLFIELIDDPIEFVNRIIAAEGVEYLHSYRFLTDSLSSIPDAEGFDKKGLLLGNLERFLDDDLLLSDDTEPAPQLAGYHWVEDA